MIRWLAALAVIFHTAQVIFSAPALETAQEKAEAILDKSIQAYGGEKKLAQLRALTLEYSYKFYPKEGGVGEARRRFTRNTRDLDDQPFGGEWGHSLVRFKAKGDKMAPLGESTIRDRLVIGIKVTPEVGREIRLYFDRETSLLLKREERTSLPPFGVDLVEILYEDYAGDDYKFSAKLTVCRNGTSVDEVRITEFQPAEEVMPSDLDGERTKTK